MTSLEQWLTGAVAGLTIAVVAMAKFIVSEIKSTKESQEKLHEHYGERIQQLNRQFTGILLQIANLKEED